MDALYSDMIAKREAYEAAGQAFQSAQKERDALETKYQSGMISRQDYLQGVASYQEKKCGQRGSIHCPQPGHLRVQVGDQRHIKRQK